MSVIIGLLILAIVVVIAMVITVNVLGVLLTLLVAGLIGWFADTIIPGSIPFGWLGAIIAGLLGAWIGTAFFGHFGPSIAGIAIIPAIIGAIILAFLMSLLVRAFGGRAT